MPNNRKPYLTKRLTKLGGSRRERIHIPQPPYRPVILHQRDVLRWKDVEPDTWWFIEHRRGIRRPKVGEDPKEARAVSKASVPGSLPERIVYKYLVSVMHMVSGADFDFQSSLNGGRLELGGIVADFMFEYSKMVLQVQGPTHDDFVRHKKDTEQELILNAMGYRVFYLTDDEIYDAQVFEEKMKKIFFLTRGGGGGAYAAMQEREDPEKPRFAIDPFDSRWGDILRRIEVLESVTAETLEVASGI